MEGRCERSGQRNGLLTNDSVIEWNGRQAAHNHKTIQMCNIELFSLQRSRRVTSY